MKKAWLVYGLCPKEGGQEDLHVLGAFTEKVAAEKARKFCDEHFGKFKPYFSIEIEVDPEPPPEAAA